MQLPVQIHVQPQTYRSATYSAGGAVAASGIQAQQDSRCSNSSTKCNTSTCKDGRMSCNLGKYYFKCDC